MKIAVVGLGVAGVNAARVIAAGRPGTAIDIYGAEPYLYYARPKLPAFLAGKVEQSELYFYPPEWYQERGISVHTSARVERIEAAAHRLVLAEGTTVSYDRALLAMGARSSIPPLEGVDLLGVFSLWTIEDALRIRSYAKGCRWAVVIGGGPLGLEAAWGLRVLGLDVTVLQLPPRLMPRQLDDEGAAVLKGWIEKLGIAVQVGATTERIEGSGKVQAVLIREGQRFPADLVLIAAGARSNIQVAQASGLAVNKGIVVDSHLRTSAADVYAAGDVAEHAGTIYGIIPAAIEQAQVAAQNMAEIEASEYKGTVPSNTLKIVGLDMTSIGQTSGVGEGYVELRRTEPGGQYIKLVLKDGRLQGAILLGHKEKVNYISQAVARHLAVGAHGEELLSDRFDWKAELSKA